MGGGHYVKERPHENVGTNVCVCSLLFFVSLELSCGTESSPLSLQTVVVIVAIIVVVVVVFVFTV